MPGTVQNRSVRTPGVRTRGRSEGTSVWPRQIIEKVASGVGVVVAFLAIQTTIASRTAACSDAGRGNLCMRGGNGGVFRCSLSPSRFELSTDGRTANMSVVQGVKLCPNLGKRRVRLTLEYRFVRKED